MCIIVYKPCGIKMPRKADLRKCFEANPHGAGLMWAEGGWVHIRKGFMDFDSFYKTISRKDWTSVPMVIHFRITTQGGVQKGLTHPFPVTGTYEGMRMLGLKARCAIAHNGIIGTTSDGAKDHNDTMRFVKDFAYPVLKENRYSDPDGVLSKGLGDIAFGSRLAIMFGDGKVELTGTWHKRGDGCMYSNLLAFANEPKSKQSIHWMGCDDDDWGCWGDWDRR